MPLPTICNSQVTYSFCKEFRHLLFAHVGPDGDVSATAVMQRLFDLGFGRSASRSLSLSQAFNSKTIHFGSVPYK